MKSKHCQNFVDVDWPPVLALGRFNWHIGKRRKWPFCIFVCLNFRKCYFSSKISHRSRDHLNSQGYCVIVCWLKPAEVGEDLHRRTMCGGNWRLVVILVVILTSCVDARTKILLHCFFFWNTSSRLFVNQNPELSFERRIRTKTESFTHLSLSESVCLLSERVNQRELSVCQLVRLLVRLSVPSPSVYPSPQFQCVRRCFTRSASVRLLAQ